MIGQTIGEFIVIRKLGQGGMGSVYEAFDQALARPVALKVMNVADDEGFNKRFQAEARALARLDHPNIVRIYGFRQTESGPVIVMEYVEGKSWRQYSDEGEFNSPADTLHITSQLLSALSYAHRASIIHRDIKPGNIMIMADKTVKVTDFGLVKTIDPDASDSQSALTVAGQAVGSLYYMSPEQVRGLASIDHRTDLYSSGIAMYEVLAGRPAIDTTTEKSPFWIQKQIVEGAVARLDDLGDRIPPEIARVLRRATNVNPDKRYQSAEEMRVAIDQCASTLSGSNDVAGAKTKNIPPPVAPPPIAAGKPAGSSRRSALFKIAGGVGLVGAAAYFGVTTLLTPDEKDVVTDRPFAKSGTPNRKSRTGIEMVRMKAGSFVMGSRDGKNHEEPLHNVIISKDFWIGKVPVTQATWREVMGFNPSEFIGDLRPVERVSWPDAIRFIEALNATDDDLVYRLPTEAEWEYACRAGSSTMYSFGNSPDLLNEYAWFDGNSGSRSQQVGTKQPNEAGLFDMHGNVWEWCQDWYQADYYSQSPAQDPTGPAQGRYKIVRGGSWKNSHEYATSAYRAYGLYPDDRNNTIGLRLAADVR